MDEDEVYGTCLLRTPPGDHVAHADVLGCAGSSNLPCSLYSTAMDVVGSGH